MRLMPVLSALVACNIGLAITELDHEKIQRSLEARTWAHETRDLSSLLGDLETCEGCERVLSVLKAVVKTGDDALIALGKRLCKDSSAYDSQFCNGVVEREAPSIASIIRTMEVGSSSARHFCMTFLGVCSAPAINHWNVDFASPKLCSEVKIKSVGGRKPIQVIHYSDIHVDPLYEKGSNTKCGKPTCCRSYTEDDKPGKTKNPAGPFGDHSCDAPTTLEKSMYDFIKKEFPHAAFTLFTGDIVDHGLWNTSKSYNQGLIQQSYEMMNDGLNIVYGATGNHEVHPPNIFEPESLGSQTRWVYETLSKEWSRWIDGASLPEAQAVGGYSTKYPNGNLRIISLNTNMYYRLNFLLYQKQLEKDPNGQFAWLAKELDAAEKAGENVYIIGHMPMGDADALPDGSNYFDQIVNRYASTIRAMFFGHTHLDHFEISYSNYAERTHDNAVAISYICPSLTPTSGMPSFKVYDVDPETFAVIDAKTYMADMNDESFQNNGPTWKQYYSAKEVYGEIASPRLAGAKAELSPSFWHNVTVAFEKNQTHFDAYMERKSRGWKTDQKCADKCRQTEICALRAGRAQDNCWVPVPGIHFSKRDGSGHNHNKHDECGSSVSRDILSNLVRRLDMLEMLQERFLAEGATIEPILVRREEPSSSATATQTQNYCVAGPENSSSTGSATGGVATATAVKGNAARGPGAAAFWASGVFALLAL
ncbi:Sphingomyelin phosphodiesterase [Metarhizium album ARSEF 1941]|uniref:Sphingomyelin phosphodiesterase n=1 Tax=Metarhizium album (strain ARSEF 1941) TaxID=1081103 RepID=A0A0B2WL00_METAS|nr:Sphingomyelin phosphodiesterase [Metarhizium album ARSEF 1941]KHN94344.1 Sphingomyelin phosphodiesterase [Metarhizium album ARSEF 1941]